MWRVVIFYFKNSYGQHSEYILIMSYVYNVNIFCIYHIKAKEMQIFKNILFVSNNSGSELDALKKALTLAFNNKAALQILILAPKFPKSFNEYENGHNKYLLEKLSSNLHLACTELKISQEEVQLGISIETSDSIAVHIIQYVLRGAYDLVIKMAEETIADSGFKALDMKLLRKCPCPVFLDRTVTSQTTKMKIAVAIDAESTDAVGHDLAIQLLKLAHDLSDAYNAELTIVSCWHYEHESEFREGGHFEISKESLKEFLDIVEQSHKTKFDALVQESNISGKYKVYALKGIPDETIPEFINDNRINLLVIGTLARGGITGALVGNTAENIFQLLKCSLIAKKPNGFVSPIKAY